MVIFYCVILDTHEYIFSSNANFQSNLQLDFFFFEDVIKFLHKENKIVLINRRPFCTIFL